MFIVLKVVVEGEVGNFWRVGSARNKIHFNNSISVAASCRLTQWKGLQSSMRRVSYETPHTSGRHWNLQTKSKKKARNFQEDFRQQLKNVVIKTKFHQSHPFHVSSCQSYNLSLLSLTLEWWWVKAQKNVSVAKMLCVSRTALDLIRNWRVKIRTLAIITRPQRCLSLAPTHPY